MVGSSKLDRYLLMVHQLRRWSSTRCEVKSSPLSASSASDALCVDEAAQCREPHRVGVTARLTRAVFILQTAEQTCQHQNLCRSWWTVVWCGVEVKRWRERWRRHDFKTYSADLNGHCVVLEMEFGYLHVFIYCKLRKLCLLHNTALCEARKVAGSAMCVDL